MATAKRPRAKKAAATTETKETPAIVKTPVSKKVAAPEAAVETVSKKAAQEAAVEIVSKKAASQAAAVETRAADMQEAIRFRAYELFLQRGGQHGADFEDWIRAENEILRRSAAAA